MKQVLEVRNFAQIAHARIEFGDLTILVGAQGAGKSLLLQLWKLGLDHGEVVSALRDAGLAIEDEKELLDAYFGEGMESAWTRHTSVSINRTAFKLTRAIRARSSQEPGTVFFVPAHRALLLTDGWPAPFMRLRSDTPAVARMFSQSLHDRFTGNEAGDLFPVQRNLKACLRDLIDKSVFHSGRVQLKRAGLQTRLALSYKRQQLPFMTWTAGQREFTPLLLGLYRVLLPRRQTKDPAIDWVVIEEPEMGLHPQALNAVMALVLDLLWRGYRVVLSTHSPFVLDVAFALRRLQQDRKASQRLEEAFDVTTDAQSFRKIAGAAVKKEIRTFFLAFDSSYRVTSRDISGLDPGSSNPDEADWGGLTGFSSRFNNAVADAVAATESGS